MYIETLAKRLLLASFCLAPLAAAHGQAPFTYHVAHTMTVGGEGDFDYLTFDQFLGRVFVARVGGVQVFDANCPALSLVGEVSGSPSSLTSVALLVEDRDLGFTSNGAGSSTTIVQLSTLKVLDTVLLGEETDAAVHDDISGLGRRVLQDIRMIA